MFFDHHPNVYKNHSHICRINMMRHFFIIFILFCQSCKEETPRPEFTDEKMAQIMAEIAIAEGATTMLSGFKKDSLANAYYRQVFEMNGTTLEEYEKNLRILVSDVPHTQAIVEQAAKIISEKQGITPDSTGKKPPQ